MQINSSAVGFRLTVDATRAIRGECHVCKCLLEFRKHSHVNVGQWDAR